MKITSLIPLNFALIEYPVRVSRRLMKRSLRRLYVFVLYTLMQCSHKTFLSACCCCRVFVPFNGSPFTIHMVCLCMCVWKVSSLIASGRRLYQIVIICILLFAATLKWFPITLARRVRLILLCSCCGSLYMLSHWDIHLMERKNICVNASLLPVSDTHTHTLILMMKMLKIWFSRGAVWLMEATTFFVATTVRRVKFMMELISL